MLDIFVGDWEKALSGVYWRDLCVILEVDTWFNYRILPIKITLPSYFIEY